MPMVDIDWLRDHVDVPEGLTYEQLAKDLVRVGLEEEEIHRSQVTGPIVVGYVVDCTPEPQKNGKVISWCHIDVGDKYNDVDEDGNKVPRGIICGAPNMRAGEKVVVTLPGAVLPGDFKIEPRKTYGHISEGMCASERELGLGDSHDGIILLGDYGFSKEQVEALKPGDDVMHLLHLDQPILEINVTPDRGYAFSYRGIAREFHNSTGAEFTDPVADLDARAPHIEDADASKADIEVVIQDDNPIHGVPGCDRYYARALHGYVPGSPTPNRMRRRLVRAGMRSLSLPVDVTNYVMLDIGQPMHAYDLDKIEGPIVVRRAKAGETLVTLDGKKHDLDPEDLLITDSPDGNAGSRILGIAGVMGGQYGEVTDETTNILLEAAHFDHVSIARSSRRHKIPSEAARRFERGIDDQIQPAAAQEAVDMLVEHGNATASEHPRDVNRTHRRKPIVFRANEVERLAGLDLDLREIATILTDIGCTVAGGGNGTFSVVPPSWRPDLTEPCDLVEEVARIYGYDRIPTHVPNAPVTGHVGLTDDQLHKRQVADELAQYGMVEVLSYPFVGPADYKAFSMDADEVEKVNVEIVNPLAGDRPFLRRDILPTLAQVVLRNVHRGLENVSIYELGHVYHADPDAPAIPALPGAVRPTDEQLAALDAGLPEQPLHVAGMFTGLVQDDGWLGDKRAADWTDAVEAVRRISARLGAHLELHQPDAKEVPAQWHPGRMAWVMAGETVVGRVGELHPHVDDALGLPHHTSAFELDLTALFGTLSNKPVQAKPISTFPPVKQDLAFTLPDDVTAEQLHDAIVEGAGDVLESIELFDVYNGDQVGEGMKSLAYAVTFRAPDRTLTAQDSEAIRARIVERAKALGAQLRA
ncbi:MAG: phenylalanine--tRNA ligase subunit beta [Bifidobacterium sp.]|nr:phenylalanine--tRNA ligase subunit beta [Bifidobacterium sp.]